MNRIIRKLKKANKIMLLSNLIILLIFLSAIVLFSYSVIKLSGIETTIRYIVIGLLIILFIGLFILNYKFVTKRKKTKLIISFVCILLISAILLVFTYLLNILYGSLDSLKEKEQVIYTSYLIKLKDNEFNSSSKIGMIKDDNDIEGNILAKEIIKKEKLENEIVYYDTYTELLIGLYDNDITAIFVSGNYVTLFRSVYENIGSETKVIYKLSKKMANKDLSLKSNKELNEPFTILLMGVDTESSEGVKANSSFNGDTLMLISFNPNTLNATVFSIPRDLYVPISCRNKAYNKVNSSAAGGTSCVIDTIEDLVGIEIDYYAKINFRGVVDLVDALGGVDLEVVYPFCEQDSHRSFKNEICLKKGYQHLDGEQALAFARHRHSLPTGDLTRIQNQQVLVEAMARKMVKLNSLSDVRDVLSAVSNNISVNMSTTQILSSYNILKSMVINALNGDSVLTLNKTYLEVYDKPIYLPNGMYSATLGYYDKSLEQIIEAMKVNLELIEPELIKNFYYDANTIYEKTVIGKDIKQTDNRLVMEDFRGKKVTDVEYFCSKNNIELTKVFVKIGDKYYNSQYSVGLVGNQSIKPGMELNNISSMTIYINSSN